MGANDRTARRRITFQPRVEGQALESRRLMTGGMGGTFALIPGTIATAGGSADVKITINPALFTTPKGHFTLGVDVVPATTGSTFVPYIAGVLNPQGRVVGRSTNLRAVLVPVKFNPHAANTPETFTIHVAGLNQTTGQFLLGFYLPGDADGDGVVTQTDLNTIKSQNGQKSSSSTYNFDADVNRDGRVNHVDLSLARQDLGVKTTVLPIISANLDPATTTSFPDRTTTDPNMHITGVATPGSTIVYDDLLAPSTPVTTTADASGNYSIVLPLNPGSNTFQVSTADSFGQTISGQLSPIVYNPPANA